MMSLDGWERIVQHALTRRRAIYPKFLMYLQTRLSLSCFEFLVFRCITQVALQNATVSSSLVCMNLARESVHKLAVKGIRLKRVCSTQSTMKLSMEETFESSTLPGSCDLRDIVKDIVRIMDECIRLVSAFEKTRGVISSLEQTRVEFDRVS